MANLKAAQRAIIKGYEASKRSAEIAHRAGKITAGEYKRQIAAAERRRQQKWDETYERFGPHYQRRVGDR